MNKQSLRQKDGHLPLDIDPITKIIYDCLDVINHQREAIFGEGVGGFTGANPIYHPISTDIDSALRDLRALRDLNGVLRYRLPYMLAVAPDKEFEAVDIVGTLQRVQVFSAFGADGLGITSPKPLPLLLVCNWLIEGEWYLLDDKEGSCFLDAMLKAQTETAAILGIRRMHGITPTHAMVKGAAQVVAEIKEKLAEGYEVRMPGSLGELFMKHGQAIGNLFPGARYSEADGGLTLWMETEG